MRERVLGPTLWLRVRWAEPLMLGGLLVSIASMGLGTAWDLQWHVAVGRETFWIPPHVMIYFGVALAGGLGTFAAIFSGDGGRRGGDSDVRVPSPPGYAAVATGSCVMAAAAVLDAIWHRTMPVGSVWAPPHLLGAIGAMTIAVGTIVACLQAGEDGLLPRRLSHGSVIFLSAIILAVVYFGILPFAVMVFMSDLLHLRFAISDPYIVAAIASLTVPAVIVCARRILGQPGFDVAALTVGLWGAQILLSKAMTPIVAAASGYFVRSPLPPYPSAVFQLLTLAYVLAPPTIVGLLPFRRPPVVGAAMGILYTAALIAWVRAAHVDGSVGVFQVTMVILCGAASAAAGDAAGRWVRKVSGLVG